MPVLVMKATEGFADRMTVLAHCIRYCLANDTALCVDWSDGVWGACEFDFHDIFELYDIKTMKKDQVVKLMATGKVKVNPPCWTAKDVYLPINERTFEDKFGFIFKDVDNDLAKIEGDVIVTNGKGTRAWYAVDLLNHVRIRPEVAERMRPYFKNFDSNCLIVHLRGTDRFDSQFCNDAIKTAIQFPAELPIYTVTDSFKLYEEFKLAVPRAQLVNPKGEVLKLPKGMKNGTHLTIPPILKKYDCDKFQMVIDLLVDFICIASAKFSVGLKESYFYKLARQFSQLPPDYLERFTCGTQP